MAGEPSHPLRQVELIDVEDSRVNGISIATDKDQIEDQNVLVWHKMSAEGKPITVQISTRQGNLLAKVLHMQVGRVPLYLLDCDVEGNSPEDRELTSRLYGGDTRTRLASA